MRYAILSDIHGNNEALASVLQHIKTRNIDRIICAGDVVGYGAEPDICLRWIMDNNIPTAAGNHDYAIVGKTDISFFNPMAKKATIWTIEKLDNTAKEFIKGLPISVVFEKEGISLFHASPSDPEEWIYVTSVTKATREFEHVKTPITFIGHTHQPVCYEKTNDDVVSHKINRTLRLRKRSKYLINVGSVGQPRDRNIRASYAVYDSDRNTVKAHRVKYDIRTAQEKIRQAGLPFPLADRLEHGW
jgi:predicted phosphodiesterase